MLEVWVPQLRCAVRLSVGYAGNARCGTCCFAIPWLIPLGEVNGHHHCNLPELFQLVQFCSWRDVLRCLQYVSSPGSWPSRCAQWLRTAFSEQSLNSRVGIEQTSAKFKLKMLRICDLSSWVSHVQYRIVLYSLGFLLLSLFLIQLLYML